MLALGPVAAVPLIWKLLSGLLAGGYIGQGVYRTWAKGKTAQKSLRLERDLAMLAEKAQREGEKRQADQKRAMIRENLARLQEENTFQRNMVLQGTLDTMTEATQANQLQALQSIIGAAAGAPAGAGSMDPMQAPLMTLLR